ncbi:hypothetical protein CK203_001775 [Vitis vinifera]|uniref:Fungal lipase-type domain-containing protein n=1 Tax=Vitis vinifera TaxID=29760 RepID=A0A438KJ09_VITVI|nr:hypothetical protein CK203_001775 [Vitis vinifera]
MTTKKCNKEFSSDYTLLIPEKLSFYELIRILFPGGIEKRAFVDCQEGADSNFERRWIIFISILAQKLLQFVAKPLSWFGSAFEMGLNLCSTNGGFGMLLLNYLRGKIQWPDKTSPTFSSSCGHLDKRVELDKSIEPGDSKYHAALSMMCAKIAYENKAYIKTTVEDQWKMEFLDLLILECDTIVVTFRGTEAFDADAWCTDFDISCHPPVAYYAIRKMLRERLQANGETKFLVTGHSLGAALAILFPAVLALHEETWMLKRLRVYIPLDNPGLPYDDKALMFKHFGTCVYYNSIYEGKIVAEEPNKNYFSPLMAIPKTLNAVWELIRSFIIAHLKGKEYTEGWLLRVFRVLGLIVPGVSAHGPQDYVNSTRLGSSASLLPHQIPAQ